MMKKIILLLTLSIISTLLFAQDGWRPGEMEVRVLLPTAKDYAGLHELGLNGDVYPSGYGIMYVTAGELERIREKGLAYEILKEDLNAYYRDFWASRDAYHSYEEIIQVMNTLTFNYPDICQRHDYGLSVDGRYLCALKISDNAAQDEDEPEIMFEGGIHGDEIGCSENLIRFAEDLCEGYGTDPYITEMIDNREIWLYIMVNPDGRVYMTRYNSRGIDLNRDWGYMWNGEGSSTAPYSQPETKALRSCMYDNQFVVHSTYHSGTEYVSYPWSYRPDPCPDDNHIDHLAALYSSSSGYAGLPYGQGYNGMYAINGSSKDTYYGVMGSIGWSIEISQNKQPPSSQIQYYYDANYPAMMMLIEHSGYGIKGIVSDAVTGDPVPAMILVDNTYPAYADPILGDYHKYLTAGTYDITVMANGYLSQAQTSVTVSDESVTTVNVALQPGGGYYAWRNPLCVIPDNNHDDEGYTPAALGEPDGVRYSIGKDGYTVLDMFHEVLDGPGDEIRIYEDDSNPEGYSCYAAASVDGPWTYLGAATGTASFNFTDAALLEARFIRIVDDGNGTGTGDNAGFDLDAVEALEQPDVVYLMMDCLVDDAEGNNNQRIDPGESFNLLITLRNHGGLTAENTQAYLNYDSTWVVAENPDLDFGTLGHGDAVQLSVAMTADPLTPAGSIIMTVLNVSANENGYVQSFPCHFTAGAIVEDWESNNFEQYPWQTSGTLPWTITFVGPYEGAYTAKSGNISDNQNSVLEVEMEVTGYDDISFFRKVSSEGGYDFLRFYIDGIMKEEWSGSLDWERFSYAVSPGTHTFRWEYVKDGAVSYSMDCGWIDYILFPSSNLDRSLHALANASPYQYCYPGESSLGAFIIGGTPPYTFAWSPPDSLSNANIQFPQAYPSATTVYSVNVSDNGFQSASSDIQLTVHPMPEQPEVIQEGDSLVSSAQEGNQWYDSQGMIEGATQQVYFPEKEEDYYTIVTSPAGCVSEPSNTVHFLFTDIAVNERNDLSIYPVPAKDILYIQAGSILEGEYQITLMSMDGKQLFIKNYLIKNETLLQLEVSELTHGIYVIIIQNLETGRIAVKKFVI